MLSAILLGFKNNNKDFCLFSFCPIFTEFNYIQSIIIYIGFITFGIIFFFFKKNKKEEQNEIKVKVGRRKEIFIYNNPNENHD